MPKMIKRGDELIRINTEKNTIEFSKSDGRSWNTRFHESYPGIFYDLTDNGKEILLTTSKGLFFSTSEGRSWSPRLVTK